MAPEEFELGVEIDERTNVFNMGAAAFGLIGGELDRSFSSWNSSPELYEIAMKAIQNNKNDRYASVEKFYLAWNSEAKALRD